MSVALDRGKSALLVMDYQSAIVDMVAGSSPELLPKAARALAAARKAGLKVIYVVIGFRPGFPEIGPGNKSFQALRGSGRFAPGGPGTEVHPSIAPESGDFTATKRRVSAFAGSDLEMLLRAQGIDTLVLAGISTSGVVLSTLRQAADMDFRLAVLRDACADPDLQVHACLMDKVFPRQAEVLDVEAFVAELEKA
ncbi:MAG TPA: isochorismatase family cysteine hydrolase [bacterium]|jgi:nicotinamidase-related amidase|nr:isochorismatase family cysteine hydrolase [bacterium]